MSDKPNAAERMQKHLGESAYVVFSFDTTGSMSPCINQVRQHLKTLVEKMTQDIPNLKIGLIAHGDYCDGPNCIRSLDLTNDLVEIMGFITNTPNTSGGDLPECYELVLQQARSLSWPEAGGSLVLIGDAVPHEDRGIDWRAEMRHLAEKNVKVFAMQCLYNSAAKDSNCFWEEVSGIAGTPLVILESFNDSANTIEALAYASAGGAAYKGYLCSSAAEEADGTRMCASHNLTTNRTKLDSYLSE